MIYTLTEATVRAGEVTNVCCVTLGKKKLQQHLLWRIKQEISGFYPQVEMILFMVAGKSFKSIDGTAIEILDKVSREGR